MDGAVLSYKEHQVKPFTSIYNTLFERYALTPDESVFIDDSEKNVLTGSSLVLISKKVEPDSYESIIGVVKELNVL